MDSVNVVPTNISHVVAIPYPGRGHVNPLLNFCKILASRKPDILITFVVTEEWLILIGYNPTNPNNLHFSSIPNVIPSEHVRNEDPLGFIEACLTKMEAQFEQFLDGFDQSLRPSLVVTDPFLFWVTGVGNRRNIPVAAFFPMSSTMFSVFYHLDLLTKHGHLPVDLLGGKGNELVDYIPGISPIRLLDLPSFIFANNQYVLNRTQDVISWIPKARYLLLASVYELESQAIDNLKAKLSVPVYAVGPVIPYLNLGDDPGSSPSSSNDYLQWLDCQPENSVLYVSLGSHLSLSSAQMDKIAAGLCDSGVRFLWVARNETSRLKEVCGDLGLVVRWCDQLRVLCHSSVGGFWTHCGWNSVQEGIFAGVPFLTFPICCDQQTNGKMIVEDWKIGWRMKEEVALAAKTLVPKEELQRLCKNLWIRKMLKSKKREEEQENSKKYVNWQLPKVELLKLILMPSHATAYQNDH